MMSAAVLTISDGAHHGTRIDTSGPAIASRLEAAGFTVVERKVVPDERDQISTQLRYLADLRLASVVFTTGGTGVAPRDVTPEATRDVIEREIPGFGELMRSEGRKSTPLAALSRGGAFSRGAVLVVNLPGSPRGAVESLDAVADLIPHVVDLLHNRTEHRAKLSVPK